MAKTPDAKGRKAPKTPRPKSTGAPAAKTGARRGAKPSAPPAEPPAAEPAPAAGAPSVAAALPLEETPSGLALRELYGDRCQVCGQTVRLHPKLTFAEIHVLVPQATPGPLDRNLALVLCPNHRALFRLGALALDPDSRMLYAADDQSPFRNKPLLSDRHPLSVEALRTAWQARIIPPPELLGERFRSPREVVEEAFRAALLDDEEEAFAAYIRLVAGSETMGDAAIRGVRDFSWRHFRRTAPDYLKERDPQSYVIGSVSPVELLPADRKVRIQIQAKSRNSAPLALVRVESGEWRIEFNGL